jgi:hypothetical protein
MMSERSWDYSTKKGWNDWESSVGSAVWIGEAPDGTDQSQKTENETLDWIVQEQLPGESREEIEVQLAKHLAFLAFLETQDKVEQSSQDISYPEAA